MLRSYFVQKGARVITLYCHNSHLVTGHIPSFNHLRLLYATDFDVLLNVHLSTILAIHQFNAQILVF